MNILEIMKVILTSRVWNKEIGTELDLEGARLDLVLSKNYSVEVDKKPKKAPKNKAIGKAPKNKTQDFIGSKNFE